VTLAPDEARLTDQGVDVCAGEPLMLAGWDYTFLANGAFIKQLVKDHNKYVIAESAVLLSHLIWENCSTPPTPKRCDEDTRQCVLTVARLSYAQPIRTW
jgi:hypothetical protein